MELALLVLVMTALTTSLIGVFVFLRQLAMVGDAISHTVLLGIVLAYFVAGDLKSPWLMVAAALFGVVTVVCIELLIKSGLMREDSAIGLVFPFFFALAVMLISLHARNVHLDTDIVLMGEVIFSPLDTVTYLGLELPRMFWRMLVLFVLNGSFVLIFFKELKISSFDASATVMAGFSLPLLHYSLMSLVSLTTVFAFEAVGAILLISFLVTPPATAYLLTKRLEQMIPLTLLISILNAILAYAVSLHFNVSMSGAAAALSGLVFFLVFLLNPKGYLMRRWHRHLMKRRFDSELLLLHLANHADDANISDELGWESISKHLNWSLARLNAQTQRLTNQGLLAPDLSKRIFRLTEKGWVEVRQLASAYHLQMKH